MPFSAPRPETFRAAISLTFWSLKNEDSRELLCLSILTEIKTDFIKHKNTRTHNDIIKCHMAPGKYHSLYVCEREWKRQINKTSFDLVDPWKGLRKPGVPRPYSQRTSGLAMFGLSHAKLPPHATRPSFTPGPLCPGHHPQPSSP